MRAFAVTEFGQAGSIIDRPVPQAETGQVLVRVHAAGVNAMDPGLVSGLMKDYMEHRLPLTPGLDYAGTVVAVGPDVEGLAIGDEVYGSVGKPHFGDGSWAEYVTVTAALAVRRPAALTAVDAAALPLAGATALAAIDALEVSAGDTIVIVGAGGGVGSYAIQLAAQRGVRVIAVTSAANSDRVRDLGAVEVIDYASGDVADRIATLRPGGVAGFVDMFHDAGALLPFAAVVRPGGRIVSPIAMGIEEAFAGQPVAGRMIRAALDRVAELGEAAARGDLRVTVETLPLEDAQIALDRQASRQVPGKLVLVVD